MAASTTEKKPIVEEVVAALLGGAEAGAQADLGARVERTESEFDSRTAASFCKTLVEELTDDPGSVRTLEALIVLGLAHPKVLARHRIPLAQEGRRLAVLLEKTGDVARAQTLLEALAAASPKDRGLDHELASMMRRTGNADRLVERYLHRAEEAMRDGRRREAITWLREVLLVDGSRRDVARMIRDLRYEEAERVAAWKRRVRMFGLVLFLAGLAAGVVYRELHIQREYASLAPAQEGDLVSLRDRLERLNTLIAGNPLWLGMFAAGRERSELRTQIDRIEASLAERARARLEERARAETTAEAARLRGRMAAEHMDFDSALEEFQLALQVSPADWAPRAQIETDIRAIQAWKSERGGAGAEPRR